MERMKMLKTRTRTLGIIILTALIALILTSCNSEHIRSPKPRSDWSRGIRVGFAHGLTQPSMIVEANGTVHIAWTVKTALNSGEVGYSKISPDGEFLIQTTVSIPENHLRGGSLREGGQGLELCWLSDEGVRCSPLDEDNPAQIAPYTLISAPPDIRLFTSAGEHYAWITQNGDLFISVSGGEPTRFATQAVNVGLKLQGDTLLVSWTEATNESETTVWLTAMSEGSMGEAHQISRINAGVLSGLRQVGLGAAIVEDQNCLVYGYEYTRGLEGGSAFTVLTCLNTQTWNPESEQRLELVITDKLNYQTYTGPFAISRLARVEIPFSNFTYLPSSPIALEDQMVIAVSTPAQLRYKVRQNIAMLLFEHGQIRGYQPVTATANTSLSPNLAGDADGNLYMAWLERGIGNDVYFATTNPQAADTLNQTNMSEVTVTILGIFVEAVTGLLLLPFMLLAIGLAYIAVFVTSRVAGLLRLGRWKDPIGFVSGAVVLWVVKLSFLPFIGSFVPFSTWLPEMPASVLMVYRAFWPVLIVSASLFFSHRIMKRRDISSLTTWFGLYAIIDVTLTALIYGAMLQGAT
jgi:hypothetical protein